MNLFFNQSNFCKFLALQTIILDTDRISFPPKGIQLKIVFTFILN